MEGLGCAIFVTIVGCLVLAWMSGAFDKNKRGSH